MISPSAIQGYLDFGLNVIAQAEQVVTRRLAEGFAVDRKPDRSFVTAVDLEIESMVRDRVTAQYPDHGVFGEEYGALHPERTLRWIVDPIDGTLSLRHRIPLYGTILALMQGDESLVGIISLPALGRVYAAGRGLGAYRNGERLHLEDLSGEDDLRDEVISTGDRAQFVTAGRAPVFDRLMAKHPRVRTYTDVFGHCLAFEGSVGAMVDFSLNLWDAAATRVLIEEAGGLYVRIPSAGAEREQKHDIVFGKPSVVRWVQRLVEEERLV